MVDELSAGCEGDSGQLTEEISDNNSIGCDGGDLLPQKTTKKKSYRTGEEDETGKKSGGVVINEDQLTQIVEAVMLNVKPAVCLEPEVKLGRPVETSSLGNTSSDIVCVVVDYAGAVHNLWCSDNDFCIDVKDTEGPWLNIVNPSVGQAGLEECQDGPKPLLIFNNTYCRKCLKLLLQKRTTSNLEQIWCDYCTRSLQEKYQQSCYLSGYRNVIHIRFEWMAKYLFKSGYKLLSSTTTNYKSERCNGVMYHCFVK